MEVRLTGFYLRDQILSHSSAFCPYIYERNPGAGADPGFWNGGTSPAPKARVLRRRRRRGGGVWGGGVNFFNFFAENSAFWRLF